MGPWSEMTSVLLRRRSYEDADPQGEGPVKMASEIGVTCPPRHTGGWEGGLDQVLSLSPQKGQLSGHTWTKTSGLVALRKEDL